MFDTRDWFCYYQYVHFGVWLLVVAILLNLAVGFLVEVDHREKLREIGGVSIQQERP